MAKTEQKNKRKLLSENNHQRQQAAEILNTLLEQGIHFKTDEREAVKAARDTFFKNQITELQAKMAQ